MDKCIKIINLREKLCFQKKSLIFLFIFITGRFIVIIIFYPLLDDVMLMMPDLFSVGVMECSHGIWKDIGWLVGFDLQSPEYRFPITEGGR
jgi:hypothetical protein